MLQRTCLNIYNNVQCTYVNSVSVSHNNCCNRKPISRSVYCWVTRNCQQYKNIERCTKCLYGELTPPEQWTLLRSSSKMPRYFCLISIWNFSTDFHETSQYQILQKSVQSKAYTCGQTDRQTHTKPTAFILRGCANNYWFCP